MAELDEVMESPIIALLPRGHRMDRQFGVVYDQAPNACDDLTEIEGVRTREAVLLNQLGVYFFGQVALWRHREITGFSSELQIPVSRIVDEGWVEQARGLCRAPASQSRSELPASVFRTITLLVCALLIGVFAVYLLRIRRNEPLAGVLSADVTSIAVPAPARLTDLQVREGDEVFSGQPLLTFEKLEHIELLKSQEFLVVNLEREIRRLEAQATLEAEWRSRQLEHEISHVQQQLTLRESHLKELASEQKVAEAEASAFSQISATKAVVQTKPVSLKKRPGGILFFSASASEPPHPLNPAPLARPVAEVIPGPDVPLPAEPAAEEPIRLALNPDTDTTIDSAAPRQAPDLNSDPEWMALDLSRSHLTSVRESLPATISEALGIPTLKATLSEASDHLEKMRQAGREVQVTAPVYGVVGHVSFDKGDEMPPGEIMVKILHADRYILVQLPTRRIHELQAGQEVELHFPGSEEFRGLIADVPVMAESANSNGESMAKVRIERTGRLWPAVPVGTHVDVISLQ